MSPIQKTCGCSTVLGATRCEIHDQCECSLCLARIESERETGVREEVSPPPITDSPGDLLMVLRTGVSELEYVEANDPQDLRAVLLISLAMKASVDRWVELATERMS